MSDNKRLASIVIVIGGLGGVVLLCGFCVFGFLVLGMVGDGATPVIRTVVRPVEFATPGGVVEPGPVDEATRESSSDIDFDDIVRNPEEAGWTDVKFDEYKTSIKGMRVEGWWGSVVDVKESAFGEFYVEVDMAGTEDEVDVFLYTSKDVAVGLGKGQAVTFSGVIDGLYPSLFEDYKVEVRDALIVN